MIPRSAEQSAGIIGLKYFLTPTSFYICYNTDSQILQEFKKDFSIFFPEKCVRIKVSQFFLHNFG